MAEEKSETYGADEEALKKLEGEMRAAAAKLDFERAAEIRDTIKRLRQRMLVGVADAV